MGAFAPIAKTCVVSTPLFSPHWFLTAHSAREGVKNGGGERRNERKWKNRIIIIFIHLSSNNSTKILQPVVAVGSQRRYLAH